MGQDELQKHLDKGRYGTPKLKPDEQKKYLGTFRERCYLTMTITQMKGVRNKVNFVREVKQHPEATVLLNGKIDLTLQTTYIKAINAHGGHFTIVDDAQNNTPDDLGLVITAAQAVDVEEIDIEKKYPSKREQREERIAKKKSFWKSLFH